MLISTWLKNQAAYLRGLDSESGDAKNLDSAAAEIEHLRKHRDELYDALHRAEAASHNQRDNLEAIVTRLNAAAQDAYRARDVK